MLEMVWLDLLHPGWRGRGGFFLDVRVYFDENRRETDLKGDRANVVRCDALWPLRLNMLVLEAPSGSRQSLMSISTTNDGPARHEHMTRRHSPSSPSRKWMGMQKLGPASALASIAFVVNVQIST